MADQAERESPRLPSIHDTGGREGKFRANDGAVIRYAWWRGDKARHAGNGAGCVVYFNGRTEFIEKNLETVGELVARGFDVWTLDWRGQGLSQRLLGNRHKGHIEDYGQHLRDLRLFFRDYVEPRTRERCVLLGHSMGGHVALRVLQEPPIRFTHAVLTSPLIDLYAGNVVARGLQHATAALGGWPLMAQAYVPGRGDYGPRNQRYQGNDLTADPKRFARTHAYIAANPELALGGPTLGWLNATRRSIALVRAPAFARTIRTPLLILSATADKVVSNKAQQAFIEQVPQGRLHSIEGAQHEILIEQDDHRRQFWEQFDGFVSGGDASGEGSPQSV
jgi:lysophospholipase